MLSIIAVLGSYEFGIYIWLEALVGRQINIDREDFPGNSAVLLTLSKRLAIDLSDFEAANTMLNGDFLRQVVEIGIGGAPSVLDVRVMNILIYHGWIRLQGSILMNLLDPGRYQLDLQKVEVGRKSFEISILWLI
jgi:hypothetical protein